jgi:hypothetical protein
MEHANRQRRGSNVASEPRGGGATNAAAAMLLSRRGSCRYLSIRKALAVRSRGAGKRKLGSEETVIPALGDGVAAGGDERYAADDAWALLGLLGRAGVLECWRGWRGRC